MHDTSLSKIESASSFLFWFCSDLPQDLQYRLRPYLAQPYQSALKVLDCCDTNAVLSVTAIAEQTQLSKASVRQILRVLRSVGLVPADSDGDRQQTHLATEPSSDNACTLLSASLSSS